MQEEDDEDDADDEEPVPAPDPAGVYLRYPVPLVAESMYC